MTGAVFWMLWTENGKDQNLQIHHRPVDGPMLVKPGETLQSSFRAFAVRSLFSLPYLEKRLEAGDVLAFEMTVQTSKCGLDVHSTNASGTSSVASAKVHDCSDFAPVLAALIGKQMPD